MLYFYVDLMKEYEYSAYRSPFICLWEQWLFFDFLLSDGEMDGCWCVDEIKGGIENTERTQEFK
jgi:hypothetical protein